MGSKKILEDMFKLVTLKSGEPIEEDKFNQSILSSIKVKTQKEKEAVLSELLRVLQEGNETIGEVSDGFFVCYPGIIKKTEDFVIKNLETEKLYVEKNTETTSDTSLDVKDNDEDNEKTESIESLLERFDDLDDSEFENLLDNLGDMNSSQVENFIEKYAASQDELVESGIKDEDEVEREKTEIRLERAVKGNDDCARYIARKLILLDNKKISEEELIEQIKSLKDFLADNELTEEAQKLCDEVDVYEIIAILEQQISEDKISRIPERVDKNSPNENNYETLINMWREKFKDSMQESIRIKNAVKLIKSETITPDGNQYFRVPKEMQEQQLQSLRNEWQHRRFTITESSRGLFSKEARRKIAISPRKSGLEEDSSHKAKPAVRRAVGGPRPKRRRYVLPFAMESNRRVLRQEKIPNNIKGDYISDIDFDEIYEMAAVPIKVDSFRKDIGFIKSQKSRIRPVVGKIEVGSSRPIAEKIERIKAFLTSKAGKRQMEEASQMLLGLITEKEEPVSEVSVDTENSFKNTNKSQNNSSKDRQTPDEY